MINFHPSEAQLRAFLAGDMPPTLSLLIAAHIDMCPRCAALVRELSDDIAEAALAYRAEEGVAMDPAVDREMAQMKAAITALPAVASPPPAVVPQQDLELDGKRFKLPKALQRYASKTLQWKKLVGKLWQAQVDIGEEVRAEFIYMERNGSVPEHTHKGNEWTLVVNGEFSDGQHHYRSGDLIMLDDDHKHAPVTNDPEGCLVFSIVDQPLHFTSGIARLLNPFSQLFFKL